MTTPRVSHSVPAEARMGNDIARQFAHLPGPDAAEAVAKHIETFWDPRMRARLEALVSAQDDSLDPLLVDAAGRLAVVDEGTRTEPDAHP